ncbi:MAG: EamA family transporter, partial [Alphaproteobacteria bacterium]|nr:EamA family transporter [Alphaproteobacteria bacterium]
MTRLQRETAIGGSAVLMWGALALLTTWTGDIPPFQLVAMSFAIAFGLALGKWVIYRERPARYLRHPPAVWMLGIGGLF